MRHVRVQTAVQVGPHVDQTLAAGNKGIKSMWTTPHGLFMDTEYGEYLVPYTNLIFLTFARDLKQ